MCVSAKILRCLIACVIGWCGAAASVVGAATYEPPLIEVPFGCAQAEKAHIVFTGTVAAVDDRTAQFEIDTVRSGKRDPFATDDLINVRYGGDVQYLVTGNTYLVGASIEPTLGVLVSRVSDPVAHFGGDDVIGQSERNTACPEFESPTITLTPDGFRLPTPVLASLHGKTDQVVSAVTLPAAVGLGAIVALAVFKNSIVAAVRSVMGQRPIHGERTRH